MLKREGPPPSPLDLRLRQPRRGQRQIALVLLQRSQVGGHRIAVGVVDNLVQRVQHRRQPAQERERAIEPGGLVALVAFPPQPHAEADGLGAVRNRGVVLQFEMARFVVRVAHAVAAGDERAGDAERGDQVAVGDAVAARELKPRLVDDPGVQHRGFGDHQVLVVAAAAVGAGVGERTGGDAGREGGAAVTGVVARVKALFQPHRQGVVGAQLVIDAR